MSEDNVPPGEQLDQYGAALRLLGDESRNLWSVFGAFIVANAIVLGFLLRMFETGATPGRNYEAFATAIIGVFVTAAWLAALERSWSYYHFRTAVAKFAEPKDWNLLAGTGERFGSGETVHLGPNNDHFRMSALGRMSSIRKLTWFLVFLFLLAYLAAAALRGPWQPISQ